MAGVMNLGSYWFSDKVVIRMYRGEEVQSGVLYDVVSELCQRNQLPMPKVYTLPQPTPNAFATGRNPEHAAVAATDGILQILSREELMGVMGHELSHVRHRDILIGSIAATPSLISSTSGWTTCWRLNASSCAVSVAARVAAVVIACTLASAASGSRIERRSGERSSASSSA